MKQIGFFGGTFDPIHNGHLNLAIQLLEARRLDEVLFCPAFRSPFKEQKPPVASPKHRLEMIRLAIEEIPAFQICSLEIEKGSVSYTIDTLRELTLKQKAQFHLLLSDDALADFDRWREPEEIMSLAPPLIGSRSGARVPPSSVSAALEAGLVSTKNMDISSTEIRARLQKKLYCGHLVPAKTLEYLFRHSLY